MRLEQRIGLLITSCRSHLLTTLAIEVVGFEALKDDYTKDKELDEIYMDLAVGRVKDYPRYSMNDDCFFEIKDSFF